MQPSAKDTVVFSLVVGLAPYGGDCEKVWAGIAFSMLFIDKRKISEYFGQQQAGVAMKCFIQRASG